jgi:peptidoglycan/xylan/chitin deacetylase (PgdA/CDA1 family)
LKRFRVKATFFLIGRQAQVHPGLVQAELAAGMVVGDHTWDHPLRPPFATLSHKRMNNEIATTNDVLDSLGAGGCLFRPPGGSYSKEVLDVASSVRCRVVLWSVDPKDWMPGRTSAEIARSVLSSVRPGSIILLHDGGGNRSATIAALSSIIKGILKKGLKIVPVTAAP